MKNRILYLLTSATMAFIATSCGDFVEPGRDNVLTKEDIVANPVLAEGVLLEAYQGFPTSTNYTAPATDDAASNNISNGYLAIATGAWRSTNNPLSYWDNYRYIAYINYFLENIVDHVKWSYTSSWRAENYPRRLKGEAYALRAYHHYLILQAAAGYSTSGELLGIPYMDKFVSPKDDISGLGRDSYEVCVSKLAADIDRAVELLPDTWADTSSDNPDKEDYDAVYGARNNCRINASAAKLLKARVLLHAASPAFNPDNQLQKWADAADAAAQVIDLFGGIAALSSSRVEYYLSTGSNDILWRETYTNSSNIEKILFPPSLNGNGRLNPSQNLVDAFPMANGYPIDDSHSGYDASNPYANRDPRLAKYVVVNGSKLKGAIINTVDNASDGINRTEYSTTTGYYTRKFTNENVSLATGNVINAIHFNTLMRYTEAFLIYAEAANEAWGPDGKGTNDYSAREIVAALRLTTGITQPDAYLTSIGTPEHMRALVRNERRLEMCFEQNRFWDIRRWKDSQTMQQNVRGTFDAGITSRDVSQRAFDDYMIYGPIPNSEVVKGLKQNRGWN